MGGRRQGPSPSGGGTPPTGRTVAERTARRRVVAVAGHRADAATARAHLADPDAAVRATALRALDRAGGLAPADLATAAGDPDPAVRRAAAEVAARGTAGAEGVVRGLLGDHDATVVEVAAWAAGELAPGPDGEEVVCRLGELATGHEDALVREAAVAALGARGDEAGLPAILAATTDKATVRRRAVLALAPFEGPEVDAALDRARADRDRQVRQAAEDLLDPP